MQDFKSLEYKAKLKKGQHLNSLGYVVEVLKGHEKRLKPL